MIWNKLNLVALATVLVLAVPLESIAGGMGKMEIQNSDTIKSVLVQQVGKSVKLRLKAGEEVGGVVTKVGDNVVHVSELSGREYFDAVIGLDSIGAVIVRVRGN